MSSAAPTDRHLAGAVMMLVAVGGFTAMDGILKHLAAQHDVLLLVWARYVLQALLVAALAPAIGMSRVFPTSQPGLHILRGALLATATAFVVLALTQLPMAQTYAISFSTPLIATALAIPLLGERASARDWTCIGVGFLGVLVALRPDPSTMSLALLLPLAMATANAGYQVVTRLAGRREGPFTLLFHVALFGAMWSSLALPWVLGPLPKETVGWLLLGGAFGTLGQLLLIQAFRIAPTAIVSPMGYGQILWAVGIGYFAFGEVPSAWSLAGGAIVAASGIALIWRRPPPTAA